MPDRERAALADVGAPIDGCVRQWGATESRAEQRQLQRCRAVIASD